MNRYYPIEYYKKFLDPFENLSNWQRLMIKYMLIMAFALLAVAFVYSLFAGQAVKEDNVHMFLPWLNYSQNFVDWASRFIPIINKVPEKIGYRWHYIKLYQNLYAVNWFIAFLVSSCYLIAVFLLYWESRDKMIYLEIKDYIKGTLFSLLIITIIIYSIFFTSLSLEISPMTIFSRSFWMLLAFCILVSCLLSMLVNLKAILIKKKF